MLMVIWRKGSKRETQPSDNGTKATAVAATETKPAASQPKPVPQPKKAEPVKKEEPKQKKESKEGPCGLPSKCVIL